MSTHVASRLVRAVGSCLLTSLVLAACADSSGGNAATERTVTSDSTTTSQPGKTSQPSGGCTTTGKTPTAQSPITEEFEFGGALRTATIAVPDDYDATEAVPLVFAFHGHGSSKEINEADSEMGARGASRGFIVVTGDALGQPRQWNMFGAADQPDDFAFVNAFVEQLGKDWCIDLDRVFASGHSNGSAFTGFLACVPPFRFAAVAMVAATIPSSCPDDHHPSVLAISGDADQTVPYDGGGVGGNGGVGIPPALDTMKSYRVTYGCDSEPKVETVRPGVRRDRGVGCANGSRVELITVIGGTHSWPGGLGASLDPNTSSAGREFSATDAILDFFEDTPAG